MDPRVAPEQGRTGHEKPEERQETLSTLSSEEVFCASHELSDAAEGGLRRQVSAEPRIKQINRGELQRHDRVGTGLTADVFKGSWGGKHVAIKQLHCAKGGKEQAAQLNHEVHALLRETGILTQTSHENLVQFFGLVIDEHPYLLITEFCNGGTCFVLVHEDELQLETKQQLKICCDVAHGMDYLHAFQPQIIHRDLKSMNLLLAEPVTKKRDIPLVKVCDFGLSRMKDDPDGWGSLTQEVGTPNWMAPEVLRGNYNEKIDIYSFAMVLFEVIGQEIPFEDCDPGEVMKRASEGARPDLEAIPPWIPKDFVQLMEQSWAHKPNDRPSFQYIATTLDAIVARMLVVQK